MWGLLLTLTLLAFQPCIAEAQTKQGEFLGAKQIESMPNWFKTTFMDFSEDIQEAADSNRHVMIYFHQNGCPYCAKLVADNFHNEALVTKLKQHFDVIETNMWGDRELTDWQGNEHTEKAFAAQMKVQFTPTLVFLDSMGNTVLRLNGYQSTNNMHKVLDYVANKQYLKQSFASYSNNLKRHKTGKLNKNALFESAPHILSRSHAFPAQKYLAVFFEQPNCQSCDDFHKSIMPLEQTKNILKSMQVVQLNALSDEKIIVPSGRRTNASKWYESLNLTYKPAVVFFDKNGREIIRKDAFFKAYHFQSILTYVLSGAYQQQTNFQRYIEEQSDKLRAEGTTVDIWK